jgi:hypothetical protein
MKNLIAILSLLLASAGATSQESTPVWPQDRILDQLVGDWNAKGIAHEHPYTWKMHGEWVLSHQFLRLTEKSAENIFGIGRPFEAIYYFRYDYKEGRYISHLLKNFGSEESSVLGYSQVNGDQLSFVYKLPQETVTEQFTWEPTSKHWNWKSWGDPPDGKRIDILDLELVKSN